MTITEIREHLLHGDAEFQKLAEEHARYSTQLQQLRGPPTVVPKTCSSN